MEHLKKEVREIETLSDITCDFCGKSCKRATLGHGHEFEFATLHCSFGYYSDGLDGECRNLHLCESCYIDVIKTFNVPEDAGRV